MVERETKAAYENHGYIPEILYYEDYQKVRSIHQGNNPEQHTSEFIQNKLGRAKEQKVILHDNFIQNKANNFSINEKNADFKPQTFSENYGQEIQMSNPESCTGKEETSDGSASLEHEQDNILGWVVVVAASFMWMTTNLMNRCFTLLFAEILEDSESSSIIAIIINLFGFIMNVSGLPTGILVRSFGFRKITFASSCIFFFAMIVSSFAKQSWYLLISYSIFTGISCGAFKNISLTIIPYYFNKNKGRAVAIFYLLGSGGLALLPTVIEWLQEKYGRQGSILILSGLPLNCCVAAAVIRPTAMHQTFQTLKLKRTNACGYAQSDTTCKKKLDAESNKKNLCKDKRRSFYIIDNLKESVAADFLLFRSARAIIISFGVSLFYCSFINFSSFMPLIVQEYGFSLKDAANLASVTLICETISRFIVSVLSDFECFSYKVNIIVSHLLLIASMIGLFLIENIYWMTVMSALLGSGIGAFMSTQSLLMVHYMGVDNLSAVMGFTMLVSSGILISLGSLAGFVLDLGLGILGYASFIASLTTISLVLWQMMPLAIRYDQGKDETDRERRGN